MAYFNGFDTVRMTADSIPVRITNATINVTEVGGGSLGTVTSDEFGFVAGVDLAASSGAVVEFRHPSYQGRFRRTLADTAELASELLDNISPGFIVQDLGTNEIDPIAYAVWLEDLDDPNAADRFLGYAVPGVLTTFPHETVGPVQHFNVYTNPVTADGAHKFHRHRDATPEPLYVASSAPDTRTTTIGISSLFDNVEDETTNAGTGEESLMLNTISAGRLAATGDKIVAEYAGVVNGNGKELNLYFGGTQILAGITNSVSGTWKITATIQKVDTDTVRTVAQLHLDTFFEPEYTEIGSLAFNTDLDLELKADDSAAGGTTAHMAHGMFVPGVTDYITYHGEIVTYHGVPLT